MSKHLSTINNWFQKVWMEEDTKSIYELFVPEGKAGGMGESLFGPEQFAAFHTEILKLIGDIQVTIDDFFENGDKVAFTCTFKAKKRNKSNKEIEFTGSCFAKMGDGVIINADNFFDFLNLFEQLGQLPKNSFQKALSGKKLHKRKKRKKNKKTELV